ncbi:MAG TPA: hypothetical protein VGM34_01940, partial [Chlamydiales bacterium]
MAAAASNQVKQPSSYVEVNVWLAKDRDGCTTTSSEGGKQSQQANKGLARCGHVSMTMYPQGKPSVYVSLWPGESAPAVLRNRFEEDTSDAGEGSLPDVVIRLHNLVINSMVDSFDAQKKRIVKNEITWVMDISDAEDVTADGTKANCASFVYSFLKIGGLAKSQSIYYQKTRSTGPSDSAFYNLTKCNAGDLLGGYFNWAPWTSWYFTPKALLLCTAAAAEKNALDKSETTAIMNSNQVAAE